MNRVRWRLNSNSSLSFFTIFFFNLAGVLNLRPSVRVVGVGNKGCFVCPQQFGTLNAFAGAPCAAWPGHPRLALPHPTLPYRVSKALLSRRPVPPHPSPPGVRAGTIRLRTRHLPCPAPRGPTPPGARHLQPSLSFAPRCCKLKFRSPPPSPASASASLSFPENLLPSAELQILAAKLANVEQRAEPPKG